MSPGHGPHYWQECVSGHWDLVVGGLCLGVWGGKPPTILDISAFLDVVCATKFVSIDRWFPRFFFEFSPGK